MLTIPKTRLGKKVPFRFFAMALFLCSIFLYQGTALGAIWYVKGNAGVSGGGTSWASPFLTIQEAIKTAGEGDEIWLMKGICSFSSQINVNKAVGIYGGFGGTETQRIQRDWANNITIIEGQDSVYRCFYITANATIDGLTITGGNAHGKRWPDNVGGGICINKAAPTINNCFLSENCAEFGAGVGNINEAAPIITNCTFTGNRATNIGGGIYDDNGTSPTITNCTLTANAATNIGGGIYNNNSSPSITNCIIWANTAPDGPEIYNDEASSPTVTYCDVQGRYNGKGNIHANPVFVDQESGDFHLQETSPCIDKGNNNAPDLPDNDFEGNSRTIDGDHDGTPTVDIGAFEYGPTVIADGDVAPLGNIDGTVNVGDALIALRFALSLETPTQEDVDHGDVAPLDANNHPNPDGQITVGDALVILRKALGIICF